MNAILNRNRLQAAAPRINTTLTIASSETKRSPLDMPKPLRILIREDQPPDAELVTRALRDAGFDFVAKRVTTKNEFLAELRDYAPQLILADYSLPGYDGLSALAAAQELCPETPVIIVSGLLGEEKAIESLQLGATDY